MAAIQKAIELGVEELKIYYDYEGIEKWASGEWKANKLFRELRIRRFYEAYFVPLYNVYML